MLGVHWSPTPIFGEEGEQFVGTTGRHTYYTGGQGMFVYAVIPGELYNWFMSSAVSGEPIFNAVVLLDEQGAPTQIPTRLNYYDLADSGFLYNGIAAPPEVRNAGDIGSTSEPIIDLIIGIILAATVGRDIVEEVVTQFLDLLGFVRRVLGIINVALVPTINLTINTNIRTTSGLFVGPAPGVQHFMVQGWGANLGQNVSIESTLLEVSWGGAAGAGSVTPMRTARLDANNSATLVVPANTLVTMRLVADSNIAGMVTSDIITNDIQQVLLTGAGDATVVFNVVDVDFNVLAQAQSGHDYVLDVMGYEVNPVRIARGGIANFLAVAGAAFAPCAGRWDAGFDEAPTSLGGSGGAIAGTWGAGGVGVPGLTPGSPLLDPFVGYDIIIPDGAAAISRGTPTHEYGHWVFCDMLATVQPDIYRLAWMQIILETLLAQATGIPSPGFSTNEAIADFIASQVSGGVNWFPLYAAQGGSPGVNFMYCNSPSIDCVEDNIGGATEVPPNLGIGEAPRMPLNDSVGRLMTIFHDIYDGPFIGADLPGNGGPWTFVPLPPPGRYAAGATVSLNAADEPIAILGANFPLAVANWVLVPPFNVFDFEGSFFHAQTRQMRLAGFTNAQIFAMYGLHGPVPPAYMFP